MNDVVKIRHTGVQRIEEVVSGDLYFVSDALKQLIKENIDFLLDGGVLNEVMMSGKLMYLRMDSSMRFVLSPMEG